MINAFVMTADDDEVRFVGKFGCQFLIESSASRRHQDYFPFSIFDFRLQAFNGSENRFRFHHHPLPAAKRRVVDDVVFVRGPIAQVMDTKIDRFIFLRALHHALAQRSAADLRKQGEDVDLHLEQREVPFAVLDRDATGSFLNHYESFIRHLNDFVQVIAADEQRRITRARDFTC